MKLSIYLLGLLFFISCNSITKLSVPTVFKEQATEQHVNGSKKNKMTLGSYSTSKIKRGWHVSYPGWGRGFFLENLLLNQFGILKNEIIQNEKDKFRFSVTDGKSIAHVFGKEHELTKELQYKLGSGKGLLENFTQLQEYRYIFSALIATDTLSGLDSWELLMTNIYDRKKEKDTKLFTIVRKDDDGLATNGKDTIFIKPVTLKNTEGKNGKQGKLFVKMLGGYELSTSDGVIAIIDIIGHNVWFYNELEAYDRLVISAISTALFARRVNNQSW